MSEGYKKVLIHVSCRNVHTVEIEVPEEYSEVPEEYSEDDIRDKAWDVGYDYDGCYDVDWEDLGE